MADATITFGADPGNVPATVEQLKQITDELFRGIPLDAEKVKAAQDAMIAGWLEVKASVLQANDAAAALRPELEKQAKATGGATDSIATFSKATAGLVGGIALLKANLSDLKPSLEALSTEIRYNAEAMGLSADSASILSSIFDGLTNPFSIVENLTEILQVESRRLVDIFYDEASATTAVSEAMREKASAMAETLKAQRELNKAQDKNDAREAALIRQIQLESQIGEVTKEHKKQLKSLLDEYNNAGESIPPKVQAIADAVHVLSSEQEQAAREAERLAEREQKAIEKSAEAYKKAFDAVRAFAADKKNAAGSVDVMIAALKIETDAVGVNGKALDDYTAKLQKLISSKERQKAATDEAVKALKEEVKALGDAAKAAQDAGDKAQKSLADAQKREKELRDKPVLSVDEAEELQKLQSNLNDLDAEAATTAEDAAQATFEFGEAQGELADSTADAADAIGDQGKKADYTAGVMSELDAATKGYEAAIQAAGDSTASTNEIVETIGENGERKFTNLTEAAGEFGDVVVQAGEDGQMVMTNLGDATARAASALPKAADGLYDVAGALDEVDRAQGEGEKEKGLAKVGADAEKLANTYLPRILQLCKEIREEAGAITLGGAGAGI